MISWLCYGLANDADKPPTSAEIWATKQDLGSPVPEALVADFTGFPMAPSPALVSVAQEIQSSISKVLRPFEPAQGPGRNTMR